MTEPAVPVPADPAVPDRPARSGTAAVVAAALVGVWTVGVTVALQGLGWTVAQVLIYYTGHRPGWLWPVVSLGNAALVAVPAALLARFAPQPAVRAAGRAWLAGASAVGLLGVVRAVPDAEAELHLALLALAAAGLALAWRDRSGGADQSGGAATAPTRSGWRSGGAGSGWHRERSGPAASTWTGDWATRPGTWTACSSCSRRTRPGRTRGGTATRGGRRRC